MKLPNLLQQHLGLFWRGFGLPQLSLWRSTSEVERFQNFDQLTGGERYRIQPLVNP